MWYFGKSEKPYGPFKLEELRLKILRGEIRPLDLIFNEKSNAWMPAQEWKECGADLFPCFQSVALAPSGERAWIVLREKFAARSRQEGPFSETEIRNQLKVGQLTGLDYVWVYGMSGWARIEDCPGFKKSKYVGNTEIIW